MIRVTRTYNSDAAALAEQFESIAEADLVALTGTPMSVLPENCESATVSRTEEALVHINGPLVSSRTVSLDYSFTLTPQAGDSPTSLSVSDTKEFDSRPAAAQTTETADAISP